MQHTTSMYRIMYFNQLNMATGESQLSLEKLVPGLYIVELRDTDGYTSTQKIIIQK